MDLMITETQKDQFNRLGYVVFESVFSENQVDIWKSEANLVISNPDVQVYSDRKGNIRRSEHFMKHSEKFCSLNSILLSLLFDISGERQCLFKDKINYKPPGGEGFHAHYDGVFQFVDGDGTLKNGWYEYADRFTNALIPLDDYLPHSGPLEISRSHEGNYESLLERTLRNGTPDLKIETIKDCNFEPIMCPRGSIIIFKNTCPHRSCPNESDFSRLGLYLTYNAMEHGDNYNKYFADKSASSSNFKALAGPSAS